MARPKKYTVPYKIPQPNNMGMVRYILAFAVVVAHFNLLYGMQIPCPVTSAEGVGGFFALSGFLIYGSYLRKDNVRSYVASRAVRLLPAYFSTVLLFAIALVAVSSLSAADYFGSAHFWKYLAANLIFMNFLEPTLPGVFESGNLFPQVNWSLWTMKVEWLLYLSVPIVAFCIKKFRWKATWTFAVVYILSIAYQILFQHLYARTGDELYAILGRQVGTQLAYFYAGAFIYFCLDAFLEYKWWIIAAAVAAFIWSGCDPCVSPFLRPMSLAVIVVWLSMIGRWGAWEGRLDNVSYNIYLLHFPVIQLCFYWDVAAFAGQWGAFLIVVAAIVALSAAMNAWIEKPIQKLFRRR